MATLLIFHEVDDVDHWLSSPRRQELFGPLGMTVRTFVDPEKTNRVGLIVEVPDTDTFQRMMESEAAADAPRLVPRHDPPAEVGTALRSAVPRRFLPSIQQLRNGSGTKPEKANERD